MKKLFSLISAILLSAALFGQTHWDIWILEGQSQINGARPKATAPAGVFTGNLLTGVKVWNGTAVVDYNVTSTGSGGNGSSWVGVGSSSSGNYSWAHIVLYRLDQAGQNVLVCQVSEGGSASGLRTIANGSHNADFTTLTATYPTTPRLLQAMNTRFNAMTDALDLAGDTYTVRGVLWAQGEADAGFAKDRIADLTAIFAYFRTMTGEANLPIFYHTVPRNSTSYRKYVEETDLTVAALTTNNHCLKLSNGTMFDGVHLDDATMLHVADWTTNEILTDYAGDVVLKPKRVNAKTFHRATEFKQVAGVTNSTEVAAVDYLFSALDAQSLTAKCRILLLGVGSNYFINAVNPYFRNPVNSGVTSTANGYSFDGVNDQIFTTFSVQNDPSMRISNFAFHAYSRHSDVSGGPRTLMSWNGNVTAISGVLGRLYLPFSGKLRLDVSTASWDTSSDALYNGYGLYTGQVRSGNAEVYKDGRLNFFEAYALTDFVGSDISIGLDIPGGSNRWLSGEFPMFAITEAFTPAEMANFYTIVQTFETMLGRNVQTTFPVPTYEQVINYANSQSMTLPNSTFLSALDTFMDNCGPIISKCNRFYYFDNGGLEPFGSINLANPGSNNITWPNGITFTSGGVVGNATNQYGDPDFNGSTQGDERYTLFYAGRIVGVHAAHASVTLDGTISTGSRNNLQSASTTGLRINSGSTQLNSSADATGTGFVGIFRDGTSNVYVWKNSTKNSRTQSYNSLINEKHVLLRTGSTYGGATIKYYAPGCALLTDTEINTLRTNLETLDAAN